MTMWNRGLLAGLVASGLVVACGASGGGGNTPADAGNTTDRGGTGPDGSTMDGGTNPDGGSMDASGDRGPTRDRGPTTDRGNTNPDDPCAAPIDLSSMTPDSTGTITYEGDNKSGALVTLGNLPASCLPSMGTKASVVAFRYTMRAAGILRVSTDNEGTDFDTVVAVLGTCSETAAPLACNDDVAQGNLQSTATTGMLMAGQTVYIAVGGWGRDEESAATGGFELTVQETVPGAMGSPCRVGDAGPACDSGLRCTVAAPTTAMPGVCLTPVAVGMPCTATTICVEGASCVANPGSTTMGTCRTDGTSGGLCRPSSAMTVCDTGLACFRPPGATMNGLCRPAVMVGAACDATGQMNACADSYCRPTPTMADPSSATCLALGVQGGYCRTDSPRCDTGFECSGTSPTSTCRAVAMAGAACDPANLRTVCASGTSCAVSTPGAVEGTCAAAGTAAGTPCRVGDAGMPCDAGLTCSAAMPTMAAPGTCRAMVAAGGACDTAGRATACATGSVCLGASAAGTCTAPIMEMEPNTQAMPQALSGNSVISASLMPGTDVDCFSIAVPMGGSIRAETSDGMGGCPGETAEGDPDTIINIYAAGGTMPIASNDDRGDLCSLVNPDTTAAARNLAAGTYTVCVSSYSSMMTPAVAIPAYTLTVAVRAP
ncbi:MAG: hypothetical protein R3A52_18315 [Polyangiales bacterium]